MFGTDFLQGVFGSVLSAVYEDAVLEIWERSDTRDSETGSFPIDKISELGVKIQFESLTEAMKLEPGYSSNEVLIRVLQHGVLIGPNADCRLSTPRGEFLIRAPITEDSTRIYWELRCRQNRV